MASSILGAQRAFHTTTIQFDGPEAGETDGRNPFTDYRLDVVFKHEGGETFRVPGYFAADGRAADSGAADGNVWEVKFTIPREGSWSYRADFRTGKNVAVDLDAKAGRATAFDGERGSFDAKPTNKSGDDFRAHGILTPDEDGRYQSFNGSGERFLKVGAGGPENFLAYDEFDGTRDVKGGFLHEYELHRADFDKKGAAAYTWDGGDGDEILGALKYLKDQGLNSLYVITDTVRGDGRDVWPWIEPDAGSKRFDVSKLDQWQKVFDYAQSIGVHINMLLNEQENVTHQNGGDLGLDRMLYYREMVARFAHLNAVTFNVSEESRLSAGQHRDAMSYISELDPYGHAVTVHTYPAQKEKVYGPLTGFDDMDGASLQSGVNGVHSDTLRWLDRSAKDGDAWFASFDENAPASYGVTLDDRYAKGSPPGASEQDTYVDAVWGHFMAGGSGAEAYFGYRNTKYTVEQIADKAGLDVKLSNPGKKTASGDLDAEWFGVREDLWEDMAIARDFFDALPLDRMESRDDLLPQNAREGRYSKNVTDYVLTDEDDLYVVYLQDGSKGGASKLKLVKGGAFDVEWFNPRTGKVEKTGKVDGERGEMVSLGDAPKQKEDAWTVTLSRRDGGSDDKPKVQPGPKPDADGYFLEEDGHVKVQFEDAAGGLPKGWVFQNARNGDNPGFQGDGYYYWKSETSKGWTNKADDGVFSVQVYVQEAGDYNLRIRTARDSNKPGDARNDLWVKVEDEDGLVTPTKGFVTSNGFVKMFGARTKWGFAEKFDAHNKKPRAEIDLDEGLHTITFAGRSDGLHIDYFELFKGDKPPVGASESRFVGEAAGKPSKDKRDDDKNADKDKKKDKRDDDKKADKGKNKDKSDDKGKGADDDAGNLDLVWSKSSSHRAPKDLDDATLSGEAFVFLSAGDEEVRQVRFYLDDPKMKSPVQVENYASFDFAGSASRHGDPLAWDTTKLKDGKHTITAKVALEDGSTVVVSDRFEIDNGSSRKDGGAPFDVSGDSFAWKGVELYGFGLDGERAPVGVSGGRVGVGDVGSRREIDYRSDVGASETLGVDLGDEARGVTLSTRNFMNKNGLREGGVLKAFDDDGDLVDEVVLRKSVERIEFAEDARYLTISSTSWLRGEHSSWNPDFGVIDLDVWNG